MTMLFPESYAESRDEFRVAALATGARMGSAALPGWKGRDGESLSIDWAVIGAADSESTLMIVSGAHGSEGLAGSAIQLRLLRHLASQAGHLPSGHRIVMVHALNPYGVSWGTRCDTGHVDLNRNFWLPGDRRPLNSTYDQVAPLIEEEVWTDGSAAAILARLAEFSTRHGAQTLTDGLLAGQYHRVDGLGYGGTELSWSSERLLEIARRETVPSGRLVVLDIHTGVAPFGDIALLPFQRASPPDGGNEILLATLAEDPSTMVGASGLARHTGLLVTGIAGFLPDRAVSGTVLEIGTVARERIRAALCLDLWIRRYAPPHPLRMARCDMEEADRLRRLVLDVFYPAGSIEWREAVSKRADLLIAATRPWWCDDVSA